MGTTYYDPNTVTYDATPATHCVSIDVNEDETPQTSRSDAGTFTHIVPLDGVSGSITFDDPTEATKIAAKVAISKNLTFKVQTDAAAAETVTLTGIKTGDVQTNYSGASAGRFSVPYIALSMTGPA